MRQRQNGTKMTKLVGKNAIVTGGNSGIGLATAKAFVDEGAKVLIVGRNKNALDRARETLGENAEAFAADVSKESDLAALAAFAEQRLGKLDVVFANAGVAEFKPVQMADAAHFDKIFNTNVRGAFFTVKVLEPLLNEGASIILTTSSSNTLGLPGSSVYAASKAALRSFARTMSSEFAPRNIRVNAISPGPIETPIYDHMGMSEDEQDETARSLLTRVPAGRMGLPAEIAKSVVFLASNDSNYMAGAELVIDGGMSQI